MTEINLTSSKILLPLLNNMVRGLSLLSKTDTALAQRINEIKTYIQSPNNVNGEQLLGTIDRAKEIASGYDTQPHGNKTPGNEVSSLPGIFYNAATEVQKMIDEKNIVNKDAPNTLAQLLLDVDRFYKLATQK